MKLRQFSLHQIQRVSWALTPCLQDEKRFGANETVTRQSLTALNALQKEGVIAASYLKVGGHRRLQVSLNITADWYQIAVLLQLANLFQCRIVHITSR